MAKEKKKEVPVEPLFGALPTYEQDVAFGNNSHSKWAGFRTFTKPGVFVLTEPDSGKRFVASATDLYTRLRADHSKLVLGTNRNRELQGVFDNSATGALKISLGVCKSQSQAEKLERELLKRFREDQTLIE